MRPTTPVKRPILALPTDPNFVIRDFRQEQDNYARLDNFIKSKRPLKVKTMQELAFALGVTTHRFTVPVLNAIIQQRPPLYAMKYYANQIFNTK